MKTPRPFPVILATTFMLALMITPLAAQMQSGGEVIPKPMPPKRITVESYATLPELVTLICDDAMESFWEFYGPSTVAVRPFRVIADYRVKKTTLLGITLADQMTAMVNNQRVPNYHAPQRYPQKMDGVIEELDGFLRIHISGRNIRGERRSYSVNIEMSEPIYRALHAYAESY